jgi:adenosylcobinamide-GDP ribazoletransferase
VRAEGRTVRSIAAGLVHELRLVGVALQFLTRVPVPLRAFESEWLNHSARHFPLIGVFVGGFAAGVLWVASGWWPPLVAALLSIAATVWLTGGFHEDGLADTCDGLGGAVAREKALAIMKDSRIGSYGALGLLLTLALKAAALCTLVIVSLPLACAACVLAHAVSRASAVALMAGLPYAGDADHAKAKPMAMRIGAGGLVVALLWALIVTATAVALMPGALAPWRVLAALAAAALVTAICARWLRRRLGGFTGDTLGATQQWSELAMLLALSAHG